MEEKDTRKAFTFIVVSHNKPQVVNYELYCEPKLVSDYCHFISYGALVKFKKCPPVIAMVGDMDKDGFRVWKYFNNINKAYVIPKCPSLDYIMTDAQMRAIM